MWHKKGKDLSCRIKPECRYITDRHILNNISGRNVDIVGSILGDHRPDHRFVRNAEIKVLCLEHKRGNEIFFPCSKEVAGYYGSLFVESFVCQNCGNKWTYALIMGSPPKKFCGGCGREGKPLVFKMEREGQ